jgi:hypothetical protein
LRRREFGQEVWKAFARSFGLSVFVWFDSVAYWVVVLRLFGWKCCFLWALAGVEGLPFQVPRGPVCASSGPAHRASSVAFPSCVHVYERLGSMRRVHSLTHQRIKTRTFQLINAQISKARPYPNPSRHPSPRRAWRRKLVFRAETGAGRSPRGPHAQRVLTAPCEHRGMLGIVSWPSKLPVKITTCNVNGIVIAA